MCSNCQTSPALRQSADQTFLASLPAWGYDGKIILLRRPEEAREAMRELLSEQVVGFDTETRPTFRQGQSHSPALVQLAGSGPVYVFQLKLCGLDPLVPLLESEQPLKVGTGIGDDVKHLMKLQPFSPAGFVELFQETGPMGVRDRGLRKLCGIFLGLRISKKEQTSNWGRKNLTESQLRYAATDAWVSRRIYQVAKELRAMGVAAKEWPAEPGGRTEKN
jgi:ribonuclease D